MPRVHGIPAARPNIPNLRSVPVEALDEHVYIIEEKQGIQEEWTGDKVVWAMHGQQTAWSKIFLSEENSFNETLFPAFGGVNEIIVPLNDIIIIMNDWYLRFVPACYGITVLNINMSSRFKVNIESFSSNFF
jgi:hypothetical protein